MRSVRCDRCGFVQAERASCRKCGHALVAVGAEREPAIGWSGERDRAFATDVPAAEPVLGLEAAAERPRFALGGGRGPARARGGAVLTVAAQPELERPAEQAERAPVSGVETAVPGEFDSAPAGEPAAAREVRPPPPAKNAPPEPIARIRSVALTASLDAAGHVMIEFRCRKCDRYGVLLVPPELMETGIEGECGSCHRSAPMTRVELEAKRFDRYDG